MSAPSFKGHNDKPKFSSTKPVILLGFLGWCQQDMQMVPPLVEDATLQSLWLKVVTLMVQKEGSVGLLLFLCLVPIPLPIPGLVIKDLWYLTSLASTNQASPPHYCPFYMF